MKQLHTLYVRIPKEDADKLAKLAPLYGARTRLARIFFHELAQQTEQALNDPEFVRVLAATVASNFLLQYRGTAREEGGSDGSSD